MPLRTENGQTIYDYADRETVFIWAEGMGEIEGQFDAATGHMFVDGVDWGTPQDYDKMGGWNGMMVAPMEDDR